jgi:hypothetical protein
MWNHNYFCTNYGYFIFPGLFILSPNLDRADPSGRRSNALVCDRSLAGISGSNLAEDMDICLLWVLCVVR